MLENREYAGHVVGGALVGVAVGMAIQKILSPRSAKNSTPVAASPICACAKNRAAEVRNNLRVPFHHEAAPKRNTGSHRRHSASPSSRSKSLDDSWKKCRSSRDDISSCRDRKVPEGSSRHAVRANERSRSKGSSSASQPSDRKSPSPSPSTTRNYSAKKMSPESPWDMLLPVDASTRYRSVVFPPRDVPEVETSQNVARNDSEMPNFAFDFTNDDYSRANECDTGVDKSIDDSVAAATCATDCQESSSLDHSYRDTETHLDSSKFRSLPIFYESDACTATTCDDELKRCTV